MQQTRRYSMSFSQELINEPLLHRISTKFGVIPNILKANVSDAYGHLNLSLTGDDEQLQNALAYLRERGVQIEEMPAQVTA